MKNSVVLCLSLLIFGSGYAMEESETFEPTDSSSASLRDGPRQPKWMQEVEKLCKELKPFILKESSRENSSSEENENSSDPIEHTSDSDDELDEFREILKPAITTYCLVNPFAGEKTLNGALFTGIVNKINTEKLTSNKIAVATWLRIIDPEHKDFFKKIMLERAIINKHRPSVKYLVNKEEVDLRTPNSVGSIPLILACEVGEAGIVKFLVKKDGLGEEKVKIYNAALKVAQHYHRKDVEGVLQEYKPGSPRKSLWSKLKSKIVN